MTQANVAQPGISGAGEGTPVRVITDVVTTKVRASDTDGAYSLFEVTTQPGGGFPAHSRRHEDVVFHVLAGRYHVLVADRAFALGPGEYVVIPRGTPHGYVNAADSDARMQVVFSPGGIHEEFLADIADDVDRQPWDIDMGKVLAVAPKYGIDLVTDVVSSKGG